ncbi:hypothetical protein [Klebsiella michiganensis]|uniref:hypothetical protein n=2 Tax=Enterobacteriaceae TaxID=543 RepID=UPI001304D2D6|nr:hypothetical protein [Klebsiella michiganensis]MDK6960217.1 hypothetical protein [Klebsiella michiganensis]MDM6714911.1 hypothetical protein [Klebsiella michiganensis]MDM6914238.1 hypothetical protein [Klebsiella michiganensis]MDM6919142.1 hypothetical protein [Klebsiella michiganensis]MDM6926236.1 hypothetical protein [Klebsiella michiganensis]
MNPTDFIRKHIIAALTAEGFAPSVVQGGGSKGTGALPLHVSVNQKGKLLCGLPFSGPSVGSWADNSSRAESGKEKAGKRWWHFSRPVLTFNTAFVLKCEMTSGEIS